MVSDQISAWDGTGVGWGQGGGVLTNLTHKKGP